MAASEGCACGGAPVIVFACSGAADVGAVADQAARRLSGIGRMKMSCLAGVGGRLSGFVKSAEAASGILAIDGCDLNCAGHTLEEAGLRQFVHLSLGSIGMRKGETPPTEENITRAAAEAARMLDARPGCCGT